MLYPSPPLAMYDETDTVYEEKLSRGSHAESDLFTRLRTCTLSRRGEGLSMYQRTRTELLTCNKRPEGLATTSSLPRAPMLCASTICSTRPLTRMTVTSFKNGAACRSSPCDVAPCARDDRIPPLLKKATSESATHCAASAKRLPTPHSATRQPHRPCPSSVTHSSATTLSPN
eukprot:255917-Prymnesium_polylepis.2